MTIVALPGTDAYYTKDLLIETSLGAYEQQGNFTLVDDAALVGAMFTAYYSYNSMVELTVPKYRSLDDAYGHDTDKWTELPLWSLMFTSVFLSWLSQDGFSFLDNELETEV